jgi:hypothetical protein
MQFVPRGADTIGLARYVRRQIVNANIRRMYRFLHPVGNDEALVHGFDALIEAIYGQLADIIEQHGKVRRCEECGKYLVQRTKRQRYCAPISTRPQRGDKNPQEADSTCAMKARVRKHRVKQKQP